MYPLTNDLVENGKDGTSKESQKRIIESEQPKFLNDLDKLQVGQVGGIKLPQTMTEWMERIAARKHRSDPTERKEEFQNEEYALEKGWEPKHI